MKKLFLLAALATAGMVVTSCSEKDVDEAVNTSVEQPSGKSYVSLAIKLPNAKNVTRANDDFADGDAAEFDIKDVTLVLFEGDDPETATYQGAYDITPDFSNGPNSQITVTQQIVAEVSNPAVKSNNFYAYVVVNKHSLIDGLPTDATTDTFDDLFGANGTISTVDEDIDINEGFVMTNAPLATVAGTGSEPSTDNLQVLSTIDNSRIFSTKEAAEDAPATTIYVERNVAKVTVEGEGTIEDTSISFEVKGWTLDNTATETYFQRQMADPNDADYSSHSYWYNLKNQDADGYDSWRFIGGDNTQGSESLYRTYWAFTPWYNDNDASSSLSHYDVENDDITYTDGGKAEYCYENTFDLANQLERNTTRAIIQMKLNDGDDFYTINGKFFAADDVKEAIANIAANYIKSRLTFEFDVDQSTITIESDPSDVDRVQVESVKLSDGTDEVELTSDELSALFNDDEAANDLKLYKDGIAYYSVLIKHFGDDLTPWAAADHMTTANPYKDVTDTDNFNRAKYLGRYGVLRNNWYNLEVTKVAAIGSTTPPEIKPGDDDWDDQVKSYINVEINVLSWAKRYQEVEL